MRRFTVRITAAIAVSALFAGAATSASFAADNAPTESSAPAELSIPVLESPTGSYIVLLAEAPLATYDGGEPGLAPTQPDEGEKLDTRSRDAKRYTSFLTERQQEVAADAGVTPRATYQVTLNGFSAKMTPQKAAKLAASEGVLRVYPDEIRHPTALRSTEYLGLEGAGGVWADLGGTGNAGKGIVVGVVDTGIAPENPAFAGNPLGTTAETGEPYLSGETIVFDKADGNQFKSTRMTGTSWNTANYSTKLIGARYFDVGAQAAGHDFRAEYRSPRDADGHGSHTASTAAGENVVASAGFSGVAPGAKIAAYKACWAGPDVKDYLDDTCALSDLLSAINAAVADGVDVINYSIGGSAATTAWAPDDIAFFNAAAAGVFVAVAAGNSGRNGASTADHASPWYTTVGASTVPSSVGGLPVMGDFSSRGPVLADGGDILKPDVAAPGVGILAAFSSAPSGSTFTPRTAVLDGTSMASPHVAGLAALYLGAHPTAVPDEIQSALMTTAGGSASRTTGAPERDPFAEGAGQVRAKRFLDPGLVYLSGPTQWAGYVRGLGYNALGLPAGAALDGSDLNRASISIGTLAKSQSVTRSLTATRPGTYKVSASISGIAVTVSPTTLTFTSAGQTLPFTVKFSNSSAPAQKWATGSMTWTEVGGGNAVVRSPLAVRPVIVDAPDTASASGISGSKTIPVTAGATGTVALKLTGLAPLKLLVDTANPVPGHSGNQNSGDRNGDVGWNFRVPSGTALAHFGLNSSDDAESDLDLVVYRLDPSNPNVAVEMWESATEAADEQIRIFDPIPGAYVVIATVYAAPRAMTWDLTSAIVASGQSGTLTATPASLALVKDSSTSTSYKLSWKGLAANIRYLGVVTYGNSGLRTVLTVDSGKPAPKATVAPKITGSAKIGSTLTASKGTWSPTPSGSVSYSYKYQWLRNGASITGATASSYKTTKSDAGKKISVRVTATASSSINPGAATSAAVTAKYGTTTKVTLNRTSGSTASTFIARATVKTSTGATAAGKVTFKIGTRSYVRTLAKGTVAITLPKQAKGTRTVTVVYSGSTTTFGSTGSARFTVR